MSHNGAKKSVARALASLVAWVLVWVLVFTVFTVAAALFALWAKVLGNVVALVWGLW